MIIKNDISLASYTTFKIGGNAKFFGIVKSEKDLAEAVEFAKNKNLPIFVIGGGSNLLISDNGYSGLVIKVEILGITFEDNLVIANAGENWDHLVEQTIDNGLCGLENLSAIPGTVGASPVQNIGAYGVEISDLIQSVRTFDTRNGRLVDIPKEECLFGYRDSIFKNQKGRFIIASVTFKLKKDGSTNVAYKDLKEYFLNRGVVRPSPLEVRNAVIEIRKSKLPNWQEWGTAGSFFKNPIISIQQYLDLKQKYPDLPGFPDCEGKIKVSLGWILDKVCNAKGLSFGNAFIYEKQALVIVTKPGAKASEVVELSRKIQDLVLQKTGIKIEAEVEWVN